MSVSSTRGQGVRSLRGCVEEGFIDVGKQHAEDDEVDLPLAQDALESGYLRVRHVNVARLCRHLTSSVGLASGLWHADHADDADVQEHWSPGCEAVQTTSAS